MMLIYTAFLLSALSLPVSVYAMDANPLVLSSKENSSQAALDALKRSGVISEKAGTALIPELSLEGTLWIQRNTAIIKEGGERLNAAISELFTSGVESFFSVLSSANLFWVEKLLPSLLQFLKKEIGLQTSTLFLRAAAAGHQDALKVFLDAGVDINCTDEDGRTAVILATKGNHLETVQKLHDRGASLNTRDHNKNTALHYAVSTALKARGQHHVAAYLAQHASPEMQDKDGINPLMMFARGSSYDEHLPIIETCLRKTRNPNLRDKEENTALTIAIDKGREEVALLMIRYLDVNAPGSLGRTPLITAVGKNKRILEALLEKGARVDDQDSSGDTALMAACEYWRNELTAFSLLLKRGANSALTNRKGETALMKAVKRPGETAKLLITHGAKTDVIDLTGKTLLMHAASGWSVENVQLALDHGGKAAINEKDKEGNTALTHALTCIHIEQSIQIIRLLLQHGATIDFTEALMVAVDTFQKEKVELILELGADIRARDKDGATVLVRLVKQKRDLYYGNDREKFDAMVEFLLEKGIDVDAADNTGMAALMYSAKKYYGEGLESILKHKTVRTVNARGPRGETALMMSNREETIKRLLEHGADPRIAADNGETALSNTWSKEVAQALLDHDPSLDVTAAARKAIEYKTREELLDFFLSKGAKISSPELLRKAICQCKHTVAAKILAAATDRQTLVNQRNDKNETILLELFKQIKEQSSWQRSSDENILACITLLLNEGILIDAADSQGTTALMLAVQLPESVRLPATKLLLSKKTDATVNAQDTTGRTALMLAVEHTKNIELCSELIAHGAIITSTCNNPGYLNNGWNVLAYAMPYGSSEQDNIPLVRYLLERAPGLDVTEAMKRATNHNKPKFVELLMDLSTHWNPVELFFECAQKKGWKRIVEKLLDEKKIDNVDLTDDAGNTALWYAAGNRYKGSRSDRKLDAHYDQELIKMLIARGAKKDIVRSLCNIAKQNTIATAALLVEAIDVQSTDEEGRTPLLICGNSHELVQILLKRGAVASGKDFVDIVEMSHYENQRAHANKEITGKEWAVPEMLIERGVLAYLSAEEKNEALVMCACEGNGPLTTAQKLIECGADVNAPVVLHRKIFDSYQKKPVSQALNYNNIPLAVLLINSGASVDESELVRRYPKKAAKTTGSHPFESDAKELKKTAKDLFESLLDKNKIDKKEAFTTAVSRKNRHVIDLLLAHGLTLEPQEALIGGIRANHIPLIELALERGADIHARDEKGRTCLMLAVNARAKEATLNLLIQRGAKVNDTDSEGVTPLMHAVKTWKKKAIRSAGILLKNGAAETINVQAPNHGGLTALMEASRENELLTCMLLEYGASIDARDHMGDSCVCYAARHENDSMVDLLLCKAPHLVGEAVRYACTKGKIERVAALLSQHAPDRCVIDFNTLLRNAAKAGNSSLVCYLIDEQKAEVDATDESGVTALELAACAKDSLGAYRCVDALLDRGAQKHKDKALYTAVSSHWKKPDWKSLAVSALLGRGASLTFKGEAGMTPLMCAVMQKEKELVELMVKRGSQEVLDAQNEAGETALLMCLKNGCGESIVMALVEAGARPDIADNEGKSPLSMVAGNEKEEKYLKREITHEEMVASDDAEEEKQEAQEVSPTREKPKRCDCLWIVKPFMSWWNKEKKD